MYICIYTVTFLLLIHYDEISNLSFFLFIPLHFKLYTVDNSSFA